MVKVYAVALVVGLIGLLTLVVLGVRTPPTRAGEEPRQGLKASIGACVGFGMGGLSSEFSPLDPSWPVSLAVAFLAAAISAVWVRYAVMRAAAK